MPGFNPTSVHVKSMVREVVLEQNFLEVLRFPPRQYHSTNVQSSSSFAYCSYQKDKRENPGNFRISSPLPVAGKHWTEKYFHFFLLKLQRCNFNLSRTSYQECQYEKSRTDGELFHDTRLGSVLLFRERRGR